MFFVLFSGLQNFSKSLGLPPGGVHVHQKGLEFKGCQVPLPLLTCLPGPPGKPSLAQTSMAEPETVSIVSEDLQSCAPAVGE